MEEWKAWGEFWGEIYDFLGIVFENLFGWSTFLKKNTASLMYRQQGRFGNLFLHSGMAIFTVVVVFFSPMMEEVFASRGNVRGEYDQGLVLGDLGIGVVDTQVSEGNKGETVEYRVAEGDTVASIAKTFGVSIDTVLWENGLKTTEALKVGRVIRVLPATGVEYSVKRGDTIYTISKAHQIDPQAIVDWKFNTFANDETFTLALGQDLFLPDAIKPDAKSVDTPSVRIALEVPPVPGVRGEGSFAWPSYGMVTQRYGYFHTGIDLANRASPPVSAAQGGTVVKAGWNAGGYGNFVVIDHGNGYKTLYGHLVTGSLTVKAGDVVKQGQKIGQMGTTGRSTGIHCHFEVFKDNKRLDPLSVLPRL